MTTYYFNLSQINQSNLNYNQVSLFEPIEDVSERMLRENAVREERYGLANSTKHGDDEGLDLFLSLPDASLEALYGEIGPVINAGKQKRQPEDEAVFCKTLSMILANAIIAAEEDRRCHYSRGKGRYKKSAYNPDWLTSGVIVRVVDALSEAGYLIKRDAPKSPKCKIGSVFQSSDKLRSLFSRFIITAQDVDYGLATRPVLILKDDKKTKLAFTLARKQEEIDSIRTINDFICSSSVQLVRNGEVIPCRLTPLRRIHNLGSFEIGGRFYGGNWQNLSQDERKRILFDGCRTVEIDICGCMPRMMYHRLQKEMVGDPYYVEPIYRLAREQGMDEQLLKASIKEMFCILVNSRDRRGFDSHDLYLPVGITKREAFRLLEERHSDISEFFFSDNSRLMMFLESEICKMVLDQSVQDRILVLPIHDSFIVKADNQGWLKEIIISRYKKVFDYEPVLRVS